MFKCIELVFLISYTKYCCVEVYICSLAWLSSMVQIPLGSCPNMGHIENYRSSDRDQVTVPFLVGFRHVATYGGNKMPIGLIYLSWLLVSWNLQVADPRNTDL